MDSNQWLGSMEATGAAANLTFHLGELQYRSPPPLKTDMVTLRKVFSNFSHRTYLHFKVKI